MSFSLVNHAQAGAAASATFSGGNIGGNLLVIIAITVGSTTISTPTDTIGNTYVDCGAGKVLWQASASAIQIFIKASCANTGTNNIVTSTGAGAIAIMEWSGSTGVVDVTGTTANASSGSGANNLTAGTLVTTAADLVIGGFGSTGGSAQTAGTNVAWAASDTGTARVLSEWFVQSAGGSLVVNGTQPGGNGLAYGAISVSFKPSTLIAGWKSPTVGPSFAI